MKPFRALARLADRSFEFGFRIASKIPGLRRVLAKFEAAYQQWGVRRWLQSSYQDARFEVDFAASMEICRKHLYFVENSWIVQKIRNLKIQFAVGVDGLLAVPNASDPKMSKDDIESWNEARAVRWDDFCRSPELGSSQTMRELCIQWEGMLFDVGNIIIHKTQDARGQPKIQTIDRLRLQTPPSMSTQENKTICQGIELEKIQVTENVIDKGVLKKVTREVITGKPAAYWFRDEFGESAEGSVPLTFTRIEAKNIIHKFRAHRPGMMVGIPDGFCVLNTIQDYDELHMLEMQCAKMASELATVETNLAGELSTTQMRRAGLKIIGPNTLNQNVTREPGAYYDLTLGGKKIAMHRGDDIKNFQVNRPAATTQQYWDLKVAEICGGYNVPKLLVMPFSLQGTVTRADLDVSAMSTAFRGDFEIIASIVREIYEWQGRWELDFSRNLSGRYPQNYKACVIRPPRAPNVDIGYTADALIKELQAGIKTVQDVYADRNQNWREQWRQIAEAVAFANELAEEFGITPGQISNLLIQETAKAGAEPEATEKEEDSEPESKTEEA